MSSSPLNESDRREMCPLTSRSITNIILSSVDSTEIRCFWDVEKPLRRNSKIFHRYRPTHAESDSRLLLQKWSKSVQDKWPKGRITLITQKNKTRFGTLRRNPWGNFPHFSCVSAHRDPKKVSTRPQGKCNIGSLSLPITRSHQLLRWGTMPQQWAKKWEGGCAPCVGGDGSPSITMSPGRRPTCVPSGILIHLAVWPQQTWAEQRF